MAFQADCGVPTVLEALRVVITAGFLVLRKCREILIPGGGGP